MHVNVRFRPLSFGEFFSFISMCNSGTYCPSFHNNEVDLVGAGNFTYMPGKVVRIITLSLGVSGLSSKSLAGAVSPSVLLPPGTAGGVPHRLQVPGLRPAAARQVPAQSLPEHHLLPDCPHRGNPLPQRNRIMRDGSCICSLMLCGYVCPWMQRLFLLHLAIMPPSGLPLPPESLVTWVSSVP